MNRSVLIIDDSAYIRKLIRDALAESGFTITGEANSGERGIDLAMELAPDVITLDNVLPDMSGIDVLKALRAEGVHSSVVVISAVAEQSVIQDCLDAGACQYIVKPFDAEELAEVMKQSVK